MDLRRVTECTVVAVRRGDHNLPLIGPETVLGVGDTVVVIGPQLRLLDAAAMFADPAPAEKTHAPLPDEPEPDV